MVLPATAESPSSAQVIDQLGDVCRDRGLPDLATRLTSLQDWIQSELNDFEAELETVPRGARVVQQAAHHLLNLGGKYLRPMCVALASKVGTGFDEASRQLALAVELVHTATLLHDDVVDIGDTRRGVPTARVMYGNAASIFAGDWLLVEALRRVRRAGVPTLLDRMLSIIDEMILAESLQLESRGRLRHDRGEYFRVVEGKTAALFRWALYAGARSGGLDEVQCTALEEYGLHLGVAFQLVDDLLDFAGDSRLTGKELFTDLREGKATYPLLLAMERDPELRPIIERAIGDGGAGASLPKTIARAIVNSLERTEALADSRALALERVRRAVSCLDVIADGAGKDALITVAEATVYREK